MNRRTVTWTVCTTLLSVLFLAGCGGENSPTAPAVVENPSVYLNILADSLSRHAVVKLDGAIIMNGNFLSGYSTRLTEGVHKIQLETDAPFTGGEYQIVFYGGQPGNTGGVTPNSIVVFDQQVPSTITLFQCLARITYQHDADLSLNFSVIKADYLQVCK